MGMTGFAFSGITEETRHVRIAFDVRLFGKVQIAPIGLGLSSKLANL